MIELKIVDDFFTSSPHGEHMLNGEFRTGKFGCDTVQMALEAQKVNTRQETIKECIEIYDANISSATPLDTHNKLVGLLTQNQNDY